MIPNSSGSTISSLAVLLPVLGVVVYLIMMPKVRAHLNLHLTKLRSYFFHESEQLRPGDASASAEASSTTPSTSTRAPIEQIEPAGWNYDIYSMNDEQSAGA